MWVQSLQLPLPAAKTHHPMPPHVVFHAFQLAVMLL